MTTISAVTSLGFSLAAVRGTGGNEHTLAFYTCSRSVALTVISLASFVTGASAWLQAAAVAMIMVQGCDAVVGITIRNMMKTVGPAGMALANLTALVWLMIQR